MSTKVKLFLLAGVFFVGLVLGSIIFNGFSTSLNKSSETQNKAPVGQEPIPVGIEAVYQEYTIEEMMAQADAIFIGEVTAISPARWNQDSGEYWEAEGTTHIFFHQIEVSISQSLVDTLGLGEKVTITVLGNSPVGGSATTSEATVIGEVSHDLVAGNRGIFFVVSAELTWRDGKRPIIRFLGNPKEGYLLENSVGLYYSPLIPEGISLNDLMRQINENRQ